MLISVNLKKKNSNYQVNEVNQNVEREVIYLSLNTIETEKCKNWTDTVSIDNIEILVKLDTGAQFNVMPLKQFKNWIPNLKKVWW